MWAACVGVTLAAGSGAAAPDPLPIPDALEARVAFWTRTMTEFGLRDILLHDRRNPEDVWTTVRLPESLPTRGRATSRWISTRLDEERAHLRALADSASSDSAAVALRGLADHLRAQQGLHEVFAASYRRSGRYLPYIRAVFAEAGIPDEIALLPHLESGFDPVAGSRAGAWGLWQFTRPTGRQYLRVDDLVDARLDPFEATHAAAAYLTTAHETLGTWPLALTSYNYGINGMRRAVSNHGRDLVSVLEHHDGAAMGFASRNFYASFRAVVSIMADPERYYPEVTPDPPLAPSVASPAYLDVHDLASHLETGVDELRRLNPSLRDRIWRRERWIPPGAPLVLPGGSAGLRGFPYSQLYPQQRRPDVHRIRPGETLSRIAAEYDTTVTAILALNELSDPDRIFAGQQLELPRRPVDG